MVSLCFFLLFFIYFFVVVILLEWWWLSSVWWQCRWWCLLFIFRTFSRYIYVLLIRIQCLLFGGSHIYSKIYAHIIHVECMLHYKLYFLCFSFFFSWKLRTISAFSFVRFVNVRFTNYIHLTVSMNIFVCFFFFCFLFAFTVQTK